MAGNILGEGGESGGQGDVIKVHRDQEKDLRVLCLVISYLYIIYTFCPPHCADGPCVM